MEGANDMGKHAQSKRKEESRGVLKSILAVAIIAVICIAAYMGIKYFDKKDLANANAQKSNVTQQKNDADKKNENSNQNIEKEDPNAVDPKNEEEEKKDDQQTEDPNSEESNEEETSISDEEKAIELAKKQYGNTDGVYFRIEQTISNGVYEVSVRDAETTREYAWYRVDVKNETVK